jgi:putative Mn2+ efflux pump MntP
VGVVELFFVAVGLSMDAFAVSICKGLGMSRMRWSQALVIGLFFGGFQAGMPVIGWFAGSQFAHLVQPVGHWIAFALLAFIGAKMIWDALHEDEGEDGQDNSFDLRELLLLAIATSIDALAVGVSFSLLEVNILFAASFIGVVTFALSVAGVAVGHLFGARWEKPSTIAGGIVLILIGVKTLVEHLV